jgi:hypothetical protein
MWGPAINNWVVQQTNQLFVKCNGDVINSIAPIYHTDDERLWVEFGREFWWVFTDTTSKQWAYGELTNYTMGNKLINEYIANFKHLLQKVGWD